MAKYERAPVHAPRLSGLPLRAFVSAIESGGVGPVLANKLLKNNGIDRFRRTSPGDAPALMFPLPADARAPTEAAPGHVLAEHAVALDRPGPRETVGSFAAAYRSGSATPSSVAERLEQRIVAFEAREPRLAFFIARKRDEVLAHAEASTTRFREGRPLSVLDGVPVVIKDELDVEGFPTTLGTTIFKTPAAHDATVVARLRSAGAIVIGKANMHEIGINPIGINPHYGACRNPYANGHISGGSSSGSAATVAAGLSPIAIGADGGGSIRIPAALCGVVGLKATFGRISEAGVPPLCWNVGHVGPIGLTVADVAAAYAIVAGVDERDTSTWRQGIVHLTDLSAPLTGVRLGICKAYFEDADADVIASCKDAVRACTDAGAVIVEIPPPDLNTVLWSHAIVILSEMAASMLPHTEEDSARFGYNARTNLALGRRFRATDLVHALRHKHALTREHVALMEKVDAIVTPTTPCVAPPIPEAALPEGESNLQVSDSLMRFIRIGNLTGFPAISVPAGYGSNRLPVGIHFMARPYEEHLLLRLARTVEASAPHAMPEIHTRLLTD